MPEASPPVPQVSMAPGGASMVSILARMARAAPVISSTVSPRTRKAMSRPPIWLGVASPDMMISKASSACALVKASPLAASPMRLFRSRVSLLTVSFLPAAPWPRLV